MSNEKPKIVVDVAKITKIVNDMLENEKMPDVLIEAHQLSMVFSLLFEQDVIGVYNSSIAYHIATFLKYNNVNIDDTFEDLAKIVLVFKQKLEQLRNEMIKQAALKKSTKKIIPK